LCGGDSGSLKPEHLRTCKGRVVIRGNDVRDETWDVAMFQELGSVPATMVAGTVCDVCGLRNDPIIEQADATQACAQSLLGGTPARVSLPKGEWPESWKHMRRPVCLLGEVFYGHPDAGGYWEQHCDQHLQDRGFDPISPAEKSWRSCYYSKSLQCSMIVCVGDFKIAGPPGNVRKAWGIIQEPNPRTRGLILDEPSPARKILGCNHICDEIDGLPMSVDHKAGVTSFAPAATMGANGNHISAGVANNAGDHVAAKAE
jgi:hypothetical protein